MNRMSATKNVVSDHLTMTNGWPRSLERKSAVSFHSIFGTILFFFLFDISIILIILILGILIPEKTKKTRPDSSKADHTIKQTCYGY